MCKKAINTISPALETITEADNLLKVKNVLALFIQTVDVCIIIFFLSGNLFFILISSMSELGVFRRSS